MSLIIGGHNASAAFDPSIFYSAISRTPCTSGTFQSVVTFRTPGHPIRRSRFSPTFLYWTTWAALIRSTFTGPVLTSSGSALVGDMTQAALTEGPPAAPQCINTLVLDIVINEDLLGSSKLRKRSIVLDVKQRRKLGENNLYDKFFVGRENDEVDRAALACLRVSDHVKLRGVWAIAWHDEDLSLESRKYSWIVSATGCVDTVGGRPGGSRSPALLGYIIKEQESYKKSVQIWHKAAEHM
ncbi:MAG: hypothetical protein NXY57DRAFT_1044260 [Lentinula lateritia]|nr:MAG: hypothetical protein NXY57DRAFT_1044260 [Lentinula lateritia]